MTKRNRKIVEGGCDPSIESVSKKKLDAIRLVHSKTWEELARSQRKWMTPWSQAVPKPIVKEK